MCACAAPWAAVLVWWPLRNTLVLADAVKCLRVLQYDQARLFASHAPAPRRSGRRHRHQPPRQLRAPWALAAEPCLSCGPPIFTPSTGPCLERPYCVPLLGTPLPLLPPLFRHSPLPHACRHPPLLSCCCPSLLAGTVGWYIYPSSSVLYCWHSPVIARFQLRRCRRQWVLCHMLQLLNLLLPQASIKFCSNLTNQQPLPHRQPACPRRQPPLVHFPSTFSLPLHSTILINAWVLSQTPGHVAEADTPC